MTIEHLVSRTFFVLDAASTVGQARATMQAIPGSATATHVVISRVVDGGPYWYLFAIDDVRAALRAKATDATLEEAFGLHEWAATPTAGPTADPESIGDSAVILDAGRPVGFVDRYFLERQPAGRGPVGAGADATPWDRAEPPVANVGAEPPEQPSTPSLSGPVRRGGHRARPPAPRPPTSGNGGGVTDEPALRSIEAEFPGSVQVDAVEWLLVSIRNAAPTSSGLAISVAAGESIDILVQPRRGFTEIGRAHV